MKLNRKLGAALLVVCMVLSTLLPASAATLSATYSEASYYTIATQAYSRMLLFQNGVVVAANQAKQYGLIDAAGREVVPFQYAGMWSLGGGLFKTQDANGLQGIVDASGKSVRAPAKVQISARNETICITDENWASTYYTLSLAPSTSDAYWGYSTQAAPIAALNSYADWWEVDGFYQVYDGDYNSGLLDAKGSVIFAPGEYAYTVVLTDSAGKTVFLVDRMDDTGAYQSALMDTGKNFLAPFGAYDRIQHDYRGSDILWVTKGDQMGAIDYSGNVLVPLGNYQDIGGMNAQGYIAAVSYDGDPYSGMTNLSSKLFKDGAEVKSYPGQFVATEVYYRDLVFSPDGQKYGVMKVDGTPVIPVQYDTIDAAFSYNGDLVVSNTDENWNSTYGLYTVDGKHVFEDKYASLSHLDGGKYKLNDGAHYGVMSSVTGQAVIPFSYLDMRVHTLSFIELFDGKNYSIVDLNNAVVVPASPEPINLFDSSDDLEYSLYRADWYKGEYDGYEGSVMPFVMKTQSGYATVYADYYSGQTYGELPYRASNINADGQFVYMDEHGLMGFGKTAPAAWAAGLPSGGTAPAPAAPTAYASATTIVVDGKQIKFDAYALKDAQGNQTNYLKLRDVAQILNGTKAQFQVGWDGSILITTGAAYTPNGSEMSTPFSGDRAYEVSAAPTKVNGTVAALDAITLKDDAGNGYTYYKLRDLGAALGFNVKWDQAAQSILVESDKPYTG